MPRGDSTLPPIPNYSFNPGANVSTGPADVVARQQEQQMQQNQTSEQSILRTTQMASQLVQSFVEMSKQRQQKDAIAAYAAFDPNKPQVQTDQSGIMSAAPQGQTLQGQQLQRQLLAKVLATNPDTAAQGITRQAFPAQPTSLDALIARQVQAGQNTQPAIAAKQATLKPSAAKIYQEQKDDGLHNIKIDANNQKIDLGLTKQPNAQAGKIYQGIGADGQTHNLALNPDKSIQDLGLAKPSGAANALSAQAKGTAEFAKTMLPHIDEMRDIVHQAAQSGYIGPSAGRVYGQFLAGKVGSTGNDQADNLLGKLRAVDTLIKSGTLKVHFGSRGGQQMYQHFSDVLNSGKQSEAEINGALDGIKSFLTGYATMGQSPQTQPSQDIMALKASVRKKLGL